MGVVSQSGEGHTMYVEPLSALMFVMSKDLTFHELRN